MFDLTTRTVTWRFLLAVLLVFAGAAHGAERDVPTRAGDSVPVQTYPADGDRLLLWLPSEFGASPRQPATARALAALGIEVWIPDLHGAWFLPPGRYSLLGIDPTSIADLIDAAVRRTGKRVFLMAPGRTAALALTGIRAWQAEAERPASVGGALLLHPNLYRRTPQGGESGEYLPITQATTAPVYVFQPDQSAAYWRVGELVATLEAGGAAVFLHRLAGVGDGFNIRPDARPGEETMTGRLPAMTRRALDLLAGVTTDAVAPLTADTLAAPEREQRTELLRPYAEPKPAPALQLADLDGREHDLAALDGQVVLVNFWATWCPPCVEEIPSLQRLFERLGPRGLTVLAVAVGETAPQVRGFLEQRLQHTAVSFPVLLDPEGASFKAWQAYAFPTTLILDRRQRIRYAVFGAFAWDGDEVVATLQQLLAEPP